MTSRYATQMALPEIGPAGQARLGNARVLVVGAGGLGTPVLSYLTGAGVGHIEIVDPDVVEVKNLHRQTLYRESDISTKKAKTAARALRDLNSTIEIVPHCLALDPANGPALAATADLVIDAADSFAVTYTLSDICRDLDKPLVSASVIGQSGYVGAYCGGGPSYRAVFPDLPASPANCASAGVLGPAVGVLGSLQAQMALSLILEQSPSPLGTVVTADLARFSFSSFGFAGAPEPEQTFPFLAAQMLEDSDRVFDLRPQTEAPHMPVSFSSRLSPEAIDALPLKPERRTVLCCRSGLRAWNAAEKLKHRGHTNLFLLAAGG